MPATDRKHCFVVMPYGVKPLTEVLSVDDAAPETGNNARIKQTNIDFEAIYTNIIKKAVESDDLNLVPTRSGDVKESGMIHREMIGHIIDADVVIVDITLENPNVFYELGIRHSLRRSTTVVIRHARHQPRLSFNIAGMRAIEYDDQKLDQSVAKLRDTIKASFAGKDVDSLVHTLFNNILITRNAPPIMEKQLVRCQVAGTRDKVVGYITGDIARITECGAWVNAENTKMEMGRLHDDSISATIRFYGAERNARNAIKHDTIREELQCHVGLHGSVEPGTVLATSPGQLRGTNNVQVILHVAALHGEPSKGYLPVRDYPGCILRVLSEVEAINAGKRVCRYEFRKNWRGRTYQKEIAPVKIEKKIEAIVIPLFGSRTSGQHPQDVADQLFRAASVYFEDNPNSSIKEIFYLAYTESDQQYCEGAIGSLNRGQNVRLTRLSRPEIGQPAQSVSPSPTITRPNGAAPPFSSVTDMPERGTGRLT